MLRAVVVAVVWLWAQVVAAQLIDVNVGGVPILQRQDVALTAGDCLVVDAGGLTVSGASCGSGSGDVTQVGPGCLTGACWTDGLATSGTTLFVWEGTTADASEFTVNVPSNPGADITWTVPDSATALTFPSGTRTLATLDGVEGLSNKTLTTPTIASFVNATHGHTAAASGGTLDVAAIGSGTLGVSRGGTGQTAATEDATLVANGSAFVASVLPSCSDATTSKLLYNSTSNAFSCGTDQTSGGGGAPTTATYVTLSTDGTLSNERVLTAGTAIDVSDAGAGSTVTIDWNSTEVGTTTWGSGSGIVWTYNASAGTDPAITFGNGTVNVSTGTLQQGGTAVALQSVDLTAGAGLSGGGTISTNRTFATDSTEANFITSSAITCGGTGADAGKINVGAIASYCDSGGALEYVARAESDGGANYLRNSTDCSLVVSEAGPCWDSDDNLLSIGDSATRRTLVDLNTAQTIANKTVDDSTSATSGTEYGLLSTMTATATSGTTIIHGLSGTAVSSPASGTYDEAIGVNGAATADDAGITTEATGVYGSVAKTGTGVVTSAFGVRAGIANMNASGAITNAYGVYIGDSLNFGGGLTTEYALYTAGSEQSRFGGSLGVGAVDPLATLHVSQATIGNEVARFTSVATNDDPVVKIYHSRATAAASATTNITLNLDAAAGTTKPCPDDTVCLVEARTVCHCTSGASCSGAGADAGGGNASAMVVKNDAGTLAIQSTVEAFISSKIGSSSITTITLSLSGDNANIAVAVPANFNHTCHVTWTVQSVGT